MEIAAESYKLVETFPREQKFGLSIQITRAAVSIPSNIAEGSSRTSDRDYKRFLEIALGSGFELETQLLIARVSGLGNTEISDSILLKLGEVQKMLSAFIRKLSC